MAVTTLTNMMTMMTRFLVLVPGQVAEAEKDLLSGHSRHPRPLVADLSRLEGIVVPLKVNSIALRQVGEQLIVVIGSFFEEVVKALLQTLPARLCCVVGVKVGSLQHLNHLEGELISGKTLRDY